MLRIMNGIVPLLLYMLPALVKVHPQTVPYVRFMGTNLPNHSYVDLTLVGSAENGGDSVQCHTDLNTCCSNGQGPDRGDWHYPTQERLPFSSENGDIYEERGDQRVDLRRRNNGGTSGIYFCTVETLAAHNPHRERVYVGLYASGGNITISGSMAFTEDSDLNGENPQFTLTLTSAGGPATTIIWTRDSEKVSGGKTILVNASTGEYIHTLTVIGKLGGLYQCIISNRKPSTASGQLSVDAPNPPFDLTVSQNELDSVVVSWAAPSGGVPATSYTIYYQQDGGERASLSVGINDTSVTISGLMEGATYSISMFSTSDRLPSNITGPQNVTIVPPVVSLTPSTSSPVAGGSLTLTCSVTLPGTVSGRPVFRWAGPGETPTPADPSTSGQVVTSTITLSALRTSQAGQYFCTARVKDSTLSSSVDIKIQVPGPTVNIKTSRSAPLYAGTSLSLTCDFTLGTSVDTIISTEMRWMVNGTVVDTSTDRITVMENSLRFSPLSISDSGSYTCVVTASVQDHVTVEEPGHGVPTQEVTVEDLPTPAVLTTMDSTVTVGDQQSLECTVSVVPFLTVAPTVQWVAPSVSEVANASSPLLIFTLNPVQVSDAGRYTCRATVDIPSVGVSASGQNSTTLTVQMPCESPLTDNTAAIVGAVAVVVVVVTVAMTIIVVVVLLRIRCCLVARTPGQFRMDVPTTTNTAYNLCRKDERDTGVKEAIYESAVVSAQPPAQLMAAKEMSALPHIYSLATASEEAVYENIP